MEYIYYLTSLSPRSKKIIHNFRQKNLSKGCCRYDDYDILFGGNNKSFLIMVLEDHCASGKSYLDGA